GCPGRKTSRGSGATTSFRSKNPGARGLPQPLSGAQHYRHGLRREEGEPPNPCPVIPHPQSQPNRGRSQNPCHTPHPLGLSCPFSNKDEVPSGSVTRPRLFTGAEACLVGSSRS